ncbi:MAG: hypothetical protein WA138_09925 [Parvibaculum sp.]
MCTHFFEAPQIIAFRMQIEIHIAQQGGERIWIVDQQRRSLRLDPQSIGERVTFGTNDTGKKSHVADAGKFSKIKAGSVHDSYGKGARPKGANQHFSAVCISVHSKNGERIALITSNNSGNLR